VYVLDMLVLERQLKELGIKQVADFRVSLGDMLQQVKQTVESIYG